jgi:hypothetical protein
LTTPLDAVERARRALDDLVKSGADDFEHLSAETREAYVDGTLGTVDREVADSHLDICPVCAEDVRDLELVRQVLAATRASSPSKKSSRRNAANVVVLTGSLAAGVALAIWLGRPATAPADPAPAPVAQTAPPPAPAPVPVPAGVLEPAEQAAVDRVLAGGGLVIPEDVQRLVGTPGVLLGRAPAADPFGPVGPKGTILLTARPRFQWTARDSVTAYSVAVYNDQFNEVMASPRVSDTTWVPATDLPRGVSYQWQVTAHTASGDVTAPVPPQPEARFRVADSATATEVTRLQQRLRDKPLELGILLCERGFILDGIAALDRAAQSPATAEQANRLKSELQPK